MEARKVKVCALKSVLCTECKRLQQKFVLLLLEVELCLEIMNSEVKAKI